MEINLVEEVVIVGGGIAGLTTALGLHRLGVGSLVLESSDSLRVSGFALAIWENAWKALDAVGVGDILRQKHIQISGILATSLITGQQTPIISFKHKGKPEARCVVRNLMLEALANELPSGTIRYLSKVVAIQESGFAKILYLSDGTTIKTKVLIGCDGINSVVAKWLGFKEASYSGRYALRGCVELENNQNLEPMLMQFFGQGFRVGLVPCDDNTLFWFFTWTPSNQDKELMDDPAKLKQYVLNKLEKMPSDVKSFIEKTELDSFHSTPLRYRHPWELMFGNISKDNVCVAGDAFHPMTPEIGQGGCCALEDAVVLARCLAEALSRNHSKEEEQYKRIEEGLKKYANERRWRCIDLVTTAYVVGFMQQSNSKFVTFFRDKILGPLLAARGWVTGFALSIWKNGWNSLDVLGVGHILRHQHSLLNGILTTSFITGQQTSTLSFNNKGNKACEVRCVRRKLLLEALVKQLPSNTIRYLSKVVAIQESGAFSNILHLADGTTIKTKVLIGCDGVNSVVAKFLGFKEASYTGRYATRGYAELETTHELEPMFMQFFGKGFRAGAIPCDDKGVYWFFTWSPTSQDKELLEEPAKLKQYMLNKFEKMPSEVKFLIEKTKLEDGFQAAPLRYRPPWELVMGNISKGNICVAGDALHPMTPDIGQGGCCALEDGIVLARCLGEAFSKKHIKEKDECRRIEEGLKKYAKERRWRCIDLITTAYVVGFIQEGASKLVTFFRDKILATFLANQLLKKSDFDCGQLN